MGKLAEIGVMHNGQMIATPWRSIACSGCYYCEECQFPEKEEGLGCGLYDPKMGALAKEFDVGTQSLPFCLPATSKKR